MPTSKMYRGKGMRSCSHCGTEFKETMHDYMPTVDPVPECWANNKYNGLCTHCCGCNHG